MPILSIVRRQGGPSFGAGRRHRRRGDARFNTLDQGMLPDATLQLPRAERHQTGNAHNTNEIEEDEADPPPAGPLSEVRLSVRDG